MEAASTLTAGPPLVAGCARHPRRN
jgi:hypothetical protein